MNQIQKLMQRGQTKLEAAYPATITIDGENYAAATAGVTTTREVEVGGHMLEVDLSFTLSKELHPAEPADGIKLTYKGSDYRIVQVKGDQAPAWTLHCQDPNK